LRCKGEADNPARLQECEAEYGFSAWYDDLWRCAFSDCAAECRAGENWGCTENYDWPPAASALVEVTLEFTGLYAVGATGRSCREADARTCSFPLDEAQVDATNTLRLDVSTSASALSRYVELEGPIAGRFGLKDRYYHAPILQAMTVRAPMVSQFVPVAFGVLPESSLVMLSMDCLGESAVGTRFVLPDLPGVEPTHCRSSGCVGTASGPEGFAQPPANDLERPVRVQVVRASDSELLAERLVYGRTGWRTQVVLVPLTRAER
jgi:hypothetical protein